MTASEGMAPVKEDHRVRVARAKREKMRAHLLNAVKEIYNGERGGERGGKPVVIDDVIRHAQVSRGTFYQYFNSLEEAVAEYGAILTVEMTEAMFDIYDVVTDPVERVATGFQTFLLRSLMDTHWGAFLTHIGVLANDNLMIANIRADIERGVAAGAFDVPSIDGAVDMLVGTKIEAIRRIVRGEGAVPYIQDMTALLLRGFGVSGTTARDKIDEAYRNLSARGPDLLSWWRPIA